MDIAVIGTGYVGLVTGVCLAEGGHHVTGIDIDEAKIAKLKAGVCPIYEPGLSELLERNLKKKSIQFSTDIKNSVENAQVIYLTVGTPPDKKGQADLSYLISAVHDIVKHTHDYKILVTKSTVPVGTHEIILKIIKQSSVPIDLVSNPEFLKEGRALEDFLKPERVVLGSSSKKALKIMKDLYEPYVRNENPILTMSLASAELAKYACNAYLASRISFINDIANFAERVGADIQDVRRVMMTDQRIGSKFLYPSTGYGGSCFPKDVTALLNTAQTYDYDLKIVRAAHEVNEKQKLVLFYKLLKYFNGRLKDKKISLWGCTFKPDTDDIRCAPSLSVIEKLLQENVSVHVYDPVGLENLKNSFSGRITYHGSSLQALERADALLLFTEWSEFRKPNFRKIKTLMRNPAIFDGRNIYDKAQLIKLGFYYEGIGV